MRNLFIFLCSITAITAIAQRPHFSFYSSQKTESQLKIDSFLILLRNEEMNFPLEEQLDIKKMTTRIRKIYYGSPNYDKYLIKGVSDIPSPYQSDDIILNTSKREFNNAIGLNIKVSDTIFAPRDSNGAVPKLRINLFNTQEVQITDNQTVDIGHVLCGIDAAFHPHAITPPKVLGINLTRIKIDSNQGAVTWIGDLGSIVAEVYFAQKSLKRKLNCEEEQKIWNEYSSAADNLGNIDSYILCQLFKENQTGFLSKRLNDFYNAPNSQVNNRYLFFVKAIGLEWDGKQFLNRKKMVKYYTDQVNDAAAFYFAITAKNEGKWNLIKALPSIFRISHHKYAKTVVESFFDAIQNELTK